MSSLTVRTVFEREVRAWAAGQVIAPGLVYVETLNVEAEPPLAPWVALTFDADQAEPLTYCPGNSRVERGNVSALVFVPVGEGFALACALADDLERTLVARDLSGDGIYLGDTIPAGELNTSGNSAARHFALIAAFDYERYF